MIKKLFLSLLIGILLIFPNSSFAIIYPANFTGSGSFTQHFCLDGDCDECTNNLSSITLTLLKDGKMGLNMIGQCLNGDCSEYEGPCGFNLTGRFKESGKLDEGTFNISGGNDGVYVCYGDGTYDKDTAIITGISCKSSDGDPAFDMDDGTTLTYTGPVDSGVSFASIRGQVEWKLEGETTWHLAKMDTPLPVKVHIRTLEESTAILRFADMSTYVMKPETEIQLLTPPKRESKMELLFGTIWVNVKKMATDGTMEIDMDQAVAGIKGTTLVLEQNSAGSSLKVLEGTVDFKSKKDGQSVSVSGGNKVLATSSGLGATEPFDIKAEQAEWDSITSSSSFPLIPIGGGIAVVVLFILGWVLLKRNRKG